MMARYIWLLGLCFTPLSFASDIPSHTSMEALHLDEAFYLTYQDKHFEAITRLEMVFGKTYGTDEFSGNSLSFQANNSGFSAGGIELSYRMPQLAELVIQAGAESNVGQLTQNELIYRLARLYLQKDEPKKALLTIKKIAGLVPEIIRDDELFLRAQIYMANGYFEDAVPILQGMLGAKKFEGFAAYNLGIALYRSGQVQPGLEQIDKAGQITSNDESTLAIKDKANLILGYRLLESSQPESARQYLDRVRLTGPFSNKALLGSGWIDASLGNFERALVPWTVLMKRNVTDITVQESFLAVPYAYGKLGLYGKAAQLYGSALENFDLELAKLDSSIKRIRTGKFLQAVALDGFNQDKNWVVQLRKLPETPETYYLLELMASSEFQESLNNYLDLDDLQKRLATWDEDIEAYQELIGMRRKHYEPLLPAIDEQVQALDPANELRLERRRTVDDLLQSMLVSPQPDLLATPYERNLKRTLLGNLRALEVTHRDDTTEEAMQIRIRSKRLIGILQWQIEAAYDQRLAYINAQLHQLDIDEENLANIYDSFFIMRKVATQSYEGYQDHVSQLITRVHDAQDKVKTLLARQGHMIEEMAINELGLRRKRLEEYQVQVIFAQAEVFDLANKKQNAAGRTK